MSELPPNEPPTEDELSNQELREKYISQDSDYSYVHKKDLDELLKKVEELILQITSIEERLTIIERQLLIP